VDSRTNSFSIIQRRNEFPDNSLSLSLDRNPVHITLQNFFHFMLALIVATCSIVIIQRGNPAKFKTTNQGKDK